MRTWLRLPSLTRRALLRLPRHSFGATAGQCPEGVLPTPPGRDSPESQQRPNLQKWPKWKIPPGRPRLLFLYSNVSETLP
jgi:hypothetical protein